MRLNYGQIYNKGHILRSDTHQREVLIRGRYLLLHLVKASMKVKVKHSLLVWHGTVSKFFVYFYFTSFIEVFFMFIYSYPLPWTRTIYLTYLRCVKGVRIQSFSGSNAGKYRPEKLQIQTLFIQCLTHLIKCHGMGDR